MIVRTLALKIQQFLCRQTTVKTLNATSIEGFGYGDVVYQFEKRCRKNP